MNIPYALRSKFLSICEETLAIHHDQLDAGINIPLGPGGYDGTIRVTMYQMNSQEFETDWEGSDPTRFPVRIKAAATALRSQGFTGTFHISHQDGLLSIRRQLKQSEQWSREELKASVEVYVEMLQKYHAGERITKNAYYEQLAQRFGRTSKAFEFRMQNISYVYSLLGRPWLPGLKPAKHVGRQVATQLEALIHEVEGKAFVPQANFEAEVKELIQKPLAKPHGATQPSSMVVTVSQYSRNAVVKAWVLQQAQGHCECCGQAAPFITADGLPYLEVHHVWPLADGGPDTPENTVAICPNCHRELHYGRDAQVLVNTLYEQVSRLRRN